MTEKKLITFNDASNWALEVAESEGLVGAAAEPFLQAMLSACRVVPTYGDEMMLLLEEVEAFLQNARKWVNERDSCPLQRERGWKTKRIPDVIEVTESEQYLGLRGSLYPSVKDALWDIWHSGNEYIEVVLTGAVGIGKSFLLEICICYMLVQLSLMRDPQAELDLARGTPIYLVLQAGTFNQAKEILFRPLYNRISASPYFQKQFPWNKDVTNELWFPNNIVVRPFSGSNDAVLGLTVVGGGITELNRMAYVTKSKKAKSAEDQLYDQAKSIYQTLIRRMVSRTMQLGKLWGKLILDAAREHDDDFTASKIKEAAAGNKYIYVYQKTQWEALPRERFGNDVFMVEVGDRTRRSRIITSMDEAINPDQVIRVPEEYRTWFEQDCEGALRDFGGIVVAGHRPAIPFREKISEAVELHKKLADGTQLFAMNSVILNEYKDAFNLLINQQYLDTVLLDKRTSFAAHVDPALKHDCAGLAVGHIIGWRMLPGIKVYDPRTKTYRQQSEGRAPIVCIDGILQIKAPYGEEIDLETVQDFIIYLRELINLEVVTADGYQSAQMIQAWRKAQFITGIVSMDTSPDPYNRVKAAYRDSRIYTPYHPVFEREIVNLQLEDGKYDHLPGGGHSKDLSDAVAGVLYLLETQISDYTSNRPARTHRTPPLRSANRGGRILSTRLI
jgi:hypothetical protein